MKKLKRMTSAIITAAMLFGFSVSADAQCCHKAKKTVKQTYCKTCFIDENSDGVCDKCGKLCAFVDKDGDGICDNCRFTDENCDGICDSRKLCENKSGNGICGKQRGKCRAR